MAYHLVITDASVDGITGHHSVVAYVEESWSSADGSSTTTLKGTPEKYGIDARALDLRHGGDVDAWLDWVASDLLPKHQRSRVVHNDLTKLQGKRIPLKNA